MDALIRTSTPYGTIEHVERSAAASIIQQHIGRLVRVRNANLRPPTWSIGGRLNFVAATGIYHITPRGNTQASFQLSDVIAVRNDVGRLVITIRAQVAQISPSFRSDGFSIGTPSPQERGLTIRAGSN